MRFTSGRNFVEVDGSSAFQRWAVGQFARLCQESAGAKADDLELRAQKLRLDAHIEARRVVSLAAKKLRQPTGKG